MAQLLPATVDKIVTLAAKGLSAGVIANRTGVSESSVYLRLHQRGLKVKSTRKPKAVKAKPPAKVVKVNAKMHKVPVMIAPAAPVTPEARGLRDLPAESGGCSWDNLDPATMCSWSIGFDRWCGETKTDGPYCSRHHGRAVRIIEPVAGRAQRPQYRVSRGR